MQRYYPDEIIDEVRLNNDIVDVVSEYVKLEKKGRDFFGLCPMHREKTPSFSVVPLKQIFYCFGCGKGGNVIQFIMNVENLDYIEALKYLAERAKIQLPEGDSSEERERSRLKKEILDVNKAAARCFHAQLIDNKDHIAGDYIKARGLKEQTLKKFGIGFSGEGRDYLYKYLLANGHTANAILKSGLVLPGKSGGYYERFKGRLIFPIFDVRGNIIGFGGRVVDNSQPKYVNSPETPVYTKGKALYALNFAKNSGEKKVLVVEGYMDVISLHQSGIINTVASLGTALTESQGRLLKKYADEIIIAYDADTAGQAAAMRGLDLLSETGCNVRVLMIPDGKDPDDYIRRYGAEEFRKLINNAYSLIEYKIKDLLKKINTETTDGKIEFLNKVSAVLAKVSNNVEREMYVRKLAGEYRISEEALYKEIYKSTKPEPSLKVSNSNSIMQTRVSGENRLPTQVNGSKIPDTVSAKEDKLAYFERILLTFLCADNRLYKQVSQRIKPEDFSTDATRKIARELFSRLENNREVAIAELCDISEEHDVSGFTRIFQKECNCEDNNKAILDIIKRIDQIKQDKRRKEILELLKNEANMSEGDVLKLKLELAAIIRHTSI